MKKQILYQKYKLTTSINAKSSLSRSWITKIKSVCTYWLKILISIFYLKSCGIDCTNIGWISLNHQYCFKPSPLAIIMIENNELWKKMLAVRKTMMILSFIGWMLFCTNSVKILLIQAWKTMESPKSMEKSLINM